MQTRAYRCYVLRLKYKGKLMPVRELLCAEPERGALLMTRPGEQWFATLFDYELVQHEMLFLAQARLVKDHGGCRQYQGLEREGRTPRWPQTWLCTPTAERAKEIVQAMADRETGEA